MERVVGKNSDSKLTEIQQVRDVKRYYFLIELGQMGTHDSFFDLGDYSCRVNHLDEIHK